MKENTLIPPLNMLPSNSMWRLRFLFSLSILFLFLNLRATENSSTENIVHIEIDSVDDNNDIHANLNQSEVEMYVSTGTVIYGIENISVKSDSGTYHKNETPQKQISQKLNDRTVIKKIVTRKETAKKVSQEQAVINLSSNQSDHSFVLTKHLFATGVTTNPSVKEVIINNLLYTDLFKSGNTNSLYSDFSFFKGGRCTEFSLFTRPPPYF